jgi:2-C-methyl-D-erythritol 4-phosphate cytidylyltransferase
MKFSAVLLAGGTSTRFGEGNKLRATVGGVPVLEITARNLLSVPWISEIVVVSGMSDLIKIAPSLADPRVKIATPGESRNESTWNGLSELDRNEAGYVLIHDGARPFIDAKILQRIHKAAYEYNALDVCVPAVDTIVMASSEGTISGIPERKFVYRGQTPQAFNAALIFAAYEQWNASGRKLYTDDCAVFQAAYPEEKIGIVVGAETNIKITTPLDIVIAESFLQQGIVAIPAALREVDALRGPVGSGALVLGGTEGIGEGIANSLADLGYNVQVLSRRTGHDVCDTSAIIAAIRNTNNCLDGGLLVLSAGYLKVGGFAEVSAEDIDLQFNVNFLAQVKLLKECAELGLLRNTRIVCIASSSYTYGRAGTALYSSAKAALVNFCQAINSEEYFKGRVSVIIPRRVDTKMRRSNFPDEDVSTNAKVTDVVSKFIDAVKSGGMPFLIDAR